MKIKHLQRTLGLMDKEEALKIFMEKMVLAEQTIKDSGTYSEEEATKELSSV